MTKSTPYLYRQALEKLANEPPTTKTALLRSLLSGIEAALRSGKTHKEIWQRLSEEVGLDISCETFCRLIRRARKKRNIAAAQGGERDEVLKLKPQQTATGTEHDPAANFRRVDASRPGFHYRATQSLDFLVHGRSDSREENKR